MAFWLSYNLVEIIFSISQIRIMLLELVAPSFLNVGRYLNLAKRELLLFKSSTGCFDWVSLSFKIVHATDLHLLKVQAVMIWTEIIVCPSTMNSAPQTGLLAFPALVPLLVLCLQPGMPSRWTNPDKVLPVPLFPSMLLPQWDTSCISLMEAFSFTAFLVVFLVTVYQSWYLR